MYDSNIRDTIIDSLGSEVLNIVKGIEILASQGYSINECKKTRMRNASMLIPCFENINILTVEQQSKIEEIFNKISRV